MASPSERASGGRRGSFVSVCVAVVLVMSALAGVGSFAAKYVFEGKTEAFSAAKAFYLESDLLVDSSQTAPRYTLQAGVEAIEFAVRNYPDSLRTSEVDIRYTVTVSKGEETIAVVSKELAKDAQNSESFSFVVEPGTYLVTVSNTQPYAKSLHAYFTVVGLSTGLTWSVGDGAGSPNLKVDIETTDYEGYVTVSLPETGVLPDNTDPLLVDATGSSCAIYMSKNSKCTLQFFKTNPSAVYTNAITVTPGSAA